MAKQLVDSGKLRLGPLAEPGGPSVIVVAILGLAFLIGEAAVLSAQGVPGIVPALIAGSPLSSYPASPDSRFRRCAGPCCFT